MHPIRAERIIPLFLCLWFASLPAGCGLETRDPNIDLNGRAVLWAGYVDTDSLLKQDFDTAVVCLKRNGLPTRQGYPLVVVVDGTFLCNGILARGCANISGFTLYLDREYLYTPVFTHEVVHWETGMGNDYHGTTQFNVCCNEPDG
jgi:hypothetical protein